MATTKDGTSATAMTTRATQSHVAGGIDRYSSESDERMAVAQSSTTTTTRITATGTDPSHRRPPLWVSTRNQMEISVTVPVKVAAIMAASDRVR